MDAYKTHGAFSWSELMTSNPKAACEFYGTLFGWKAETMDMGTGPYHVLKVGDTAPAFALKGSDGKIHKLSDYKGKTVVLAWFPKAFTGG